MSHISSVCVFCGSSNSVNSVYKESARTLGKLFAKAQIEIVFGGGQVGLMGQLADSSIAHNGKVIGVITKHLDKIEISHQRLTKLHVVDDMHARKSMMFRLSDAIVALPGGIGTLEEVFEIITWRQLNLHKKPIIVVNVARYWDPLLELLEHLHKTNFTLKESYNLINVVEDAREVLPLMQKLS